MLVLIRSRMSETLKRSMQADDVWQEALLHAWRDRAQCEWSGVKNFRKWLLQIIENRLRNLADRESAQKRGGGSGTLPLRSLDASDPESSAASHEWHHAGPFASTTPSRAAIYSEQALTMAGALESIEVECREVVRLRLFEELTMEEVASRLGLGLPAVKHRFRKGFDVYHKKLMAALASRS
jgi:RNA polymerase sigma factor (sigma-70 family)